MPLDTRIALGVQPLQVADPLAQYGQVQNILAAQSQRQAAGTSNELAQVQLGQARMTLQQAQEAQNTVAQIMGTIGQHGGPADPMEAAMRMLKDPRRQVQDAGGHLLDSYQKVQAYEAQALYTKNQKDTAPAGQPAAVAPAAPQFAESPAFGAAGREVPEGPNAAFSTPVVRGMPTNNLVPTTSTATSVNAMVAPQAATAESILAKIKQGNILYRGTPGWLDERRLLEEQYKNALDPRHATFAAINPKDYTQDSIAKFNQTRNYADLVVKPDAKNTNLGNVSPADYTPDSVQKFAASGNYSDLVLKPSKVDNLIGNVAPADYTADSLAKFATSKNYADLVLKSAKVDNKTISNVNPDSYTPDSLAKFSTSGNYADLVLRPSKTDKTIGNVNPADYTPKSVAKFNVSGNYADLVPKAPVSSATPSAPVAVMGPDGKEIYESREEALSNRMTPAGKTTALTESQGNATAYGMRMKESHALLKDLENKGETNTGIIRGTVGGVVGLVPLIGDKLSTGTDNIFNVLPRILGGMSPEQQQIQNARINFITAVLRKESGAAISPGEFITAEKLYFPQPGNDPSVIKQKQKARELAIKAMEVQAGPGAKSIQGLTPGTSGATSASDPLGLF